MRREKVFFNIVSTFILQVTTIICGFIIPKLIISTYGSNVNGLVSSITQFLAYITLLESGFGPVIKSVLFKPIAEKDHETVTQILITSRKIFRKISYFFIAYIAILCCILPWKLTHDFDLIYTISLIIIISISTFAEYFFGMMYSLFLQADQKTYVISLIQVSTLLLNTILVVTLIHFGASIQVVKLASSMVFLLRPISQSMYVKKKYHLHLNEEDKNYQIKQKWDGLASHIAYIVHNNTDYFILLLFRNLAEVSVYSVYLLIINSVKNVVQSISNGVSATLGDMIAKEEKETLNKSFRMYEAVYFFVSEVSFFSMLFLIVPFVSIYTKGITDAPYIQPAFACLMVLAKLVFMIRQPYHDLVKVAGRFKETQLGAWLEAFSNIIISIILVWKWGMVGVAIGTLFAMLMRTIELMYYTSKHILERPVWYALKRLLVIAVELGVVTLLMKVLPQVEVTGYISWASQAMIVVVVCSIVVLIGNIILYGDDIKDMVKMIKNK